jgi:sigma-B regulation protein RsbU (phosphoserine phosphatase)
VAVKILIADDEPDLELLVQQRFRKQIRANEYDFIFVRNGFEALDRVAADRDIELVLTDINMPGMDGLTLLAKLMELNKLIQPVVVSAYGDMTNIRTAMNRGAFDFLTKPIDFHDFELTLDKTLRHVRALKQAAAARERLTAIQHELTIATTIQQSILPEPLEPQETVKNIDLHALMVPAHDVGGDFYDFFALDQDRMGLVIGDVSGKGVPAALFMAICRTVFRTVALHGAPPGECMREANELLCRDNRSDLFVTLFYGAFNMRTGELEHCNAGHNPPYIVAGGRDLRWLEPGRGETVLGVLDEIRYRTHRTVLGAGDALVMYTDGVTEAVRDGGEQYTRQRLEALLRESRDLSSEQLVGRIVEGVRAFAGGAEQSDDITLLAVRRVTANGA